MRKGAHSTDIFALIAGIYAALSPIWTNNPTDTNKGTYTMVALGVLTAAVALFSLSRPDSIGTEGLLALLGVAFIISPWVMSFSATAYRPMAWTAWIVGAVTLLVGGADVQMTRTARSSGGAVTN